MIDSEFPLLLQKLEKENIKEKLHLIKAQKKTTLKYWT